MMSVEVIDMSGMASETEVFDGVTVQRVGKRGPAALLRAVSALRSSRASMVHFHVSAFGNFVFAGFPLLAAVPSVASTVLTIHSGSFAEHVEGANRLRRFLIRALLVRFTRVIAVNHQQRDVLMRFGVQAARVAVVPAFLPPAVVPKTASEHVELVRALRSRRRKIILVAGSAQAHYGQHLVVEALAEMLGGRESFGVVLAFYHTCDEQYFRLVSESVQRLGLDAIVFWDLSPIEFTAVMAEVDVFVRPTDRDGDSVSVREAAYLGKQIIASDCVARPEGSLLFRSMSASDLAQKLSTILEDESTGRVSLDSNKGAAKLVSLYSELGMGRTDSRPS
jgi:glycosyltransferase involved in cell wall biosynthesis